MSDFLNSVKADLTDRRLLPIIAVVAALLVAALAYALLGGGSSTPAPAPGPAPATAATGLAVSGSTPEKSVAETTDGTREQQGGSARDPFTPLPGSNASSSAGQSSSSAGGSSSAGSASSAGGSSSSSSGSGSGSGSGSSSGSGSGSTGGSGSAPAHKPEPQAYQVALEFGTVPAGTTAGTATLTAYENIKLQTPLPSAKQPLVVFRGVTAKGRSATFTLVGEAILSGPGACLPSAQQCQAIDLQPGQDEQLGSLQPNGEVLTYELRVVGIAAVKASAAAARAHAASGAAASGPWAVSAQGVLLLRREDLLALPDLHYSSQPGVLVFGAARHARGGHLGR